MLDLFEEFRALVSALQQADVEFAVCGGLAMAVHAKPRATVDVDLLLPGDQFERAKNVASGLGYAFEAGPLTFRDGAVEIHRLSKADPETGDLLSLDLLRVTPQMSEVWQSREQVKWQHGSLPVVSRSGLTAMKRLRGSGQDEDDIRALEEQDGED